MRIASLGEVLVIGAEVLVDVETVDVGLSMVEESMAITLSWARFPTELGEQYFFGHESLGVIDQYLLF